MRRTYLPTFLLAALIIAPASMAMANPCGFEERGRMVVIGYDVGQTAVPAEARPRLAEFAETARFRDGVCVFAQVDDQGSDEANRRVATGRAENVRRFLLEKGVADQAIKVAQQAKAFTFFGVLSSDQDDDRRVYVTHN